MLTMPWFKVDDSYWSHPKVLLSDLEARGVWVTAASWCAQHMTNGVIHKSVLHKLIPKRKDAVNALGSQLVSLGLWMDDGDEWRFHDWTEYNPTRQQLEDDLAKQRERQQRWRARRRVTDAVTNGAPSHPLRDGMEPHPLVDPPHPCPHGADSPRMCAFCRRQEPTDVV